ncbi:MAG: TonB-dependent receptor [Pseudomonadota bacterium]
MKRIEGVKRARQGVALCLWAGMVSGCPAIAENADVRPFSIDAGSLRTALDAVSTAYDVNIMVADDLIAGRRVLPVEGNYDSEGALRGVLRGTGLSYRRSRSGALVVVRTDAEASTGDSADSSGASPEDDGASPAVLETVVVTGQQIDRSLQNTKESVAVFRPEDFEMRSLLEVEDVLLQAANVAITSGGTFNISIRGISRLSFALGGTGDLGTTFYDDVAMTGNAVTFISPNLWDVEQIEILRGPQSTNVGRNALSGAMVIRTAEPQLDEFEGAIRLEAGNFETGALEGMVNVPITDNSALRVAAERSQSEGYVDNITTGADDYARTEFSTLRTRYVYEPADSFRAIATLQHVDGENGERAYIARPGEPLDSFEATSNDLNEFSYTGTTGSLNLQWEISDLWSLQSITAFSDGSYDRFTDNDLTEVDGGNVVNPTDQFNVSQELRASYRGETVRGVVGVYYLDDESDGAFIVQSFIRPALAGVPEFLLPFYPDAFNVGQESFSDNASENIALFTQWEKDFGEKITLSLGLRYDRETSSVASQSVITLDPSTPLTDPAEAAQRAEMIQPGLGAAVAGGVTAVNAALNTLLLPTNISTEAEFDALLPELGVTYSLTPDISVSAFYKRGYRAGGAELEFGGTINEFDPEYIDNFELSLRSQWLDNRLTVNANAYYGLWTDQQLSVPINGNQFNTRTENAGESTIWGFELETSYTPTDRTQLYASIGYADTEFDDFCSISSIEPTLPDCEVDGVIGKDISGNDFALSPDWTVAIGGEHFFSDKWYLQANATYQDSSFSDIENRERLGADDIFLVNASFGYRSESFDVRVYGRNLTDEFYVLSRFDDSGTGGVGILPGTPREYGIILSKYFN